MADIHVAAAIIIKGSNVLIARRPIDKHKGGYWEFPGGKVEPSETAKQALIREIAEEVNIRIQSAELFKEINYTYPEKSVHLHFFKCELFTGEAHGVEGQEIRWVKLSALSQYQFPEANQPIVDMLVANFTDR